MQCAGAEGRHAMHDRPTGNMVSAAFDHYHSQAGRGASRRTCTSIRTSSSSTRPGPGGRPHQGRGVLRHQAGRRVLHRRLLLEAGRRSCEAMGFVIDRRGGKEWEIAGIPQSMIDKFNKRRDEIEAEHQRRLQDDPDYRPEYKHELAAKTRGEEAEGADAGGAARSMGRSAHRRRTRRPGGGLSPEDRRRRGGDGGGSRGLCDPSLLRAGSVVSERELVRVALLYGLGDVSAEQVAGGVRRPGRAAGRARTAG